MNKEMKNRKKIYKILILLLVDGAAYAFCELAALFIRLGYNSADIGQYILRLYYIPVGMVITLAVFSVFRFYRILWRYASLKEFVHIVMAVAVSTGINQTVRWFLAFFNSEMEVLLRPRSCALISGMLLFLVVFGGRMSARLLSGEMKNPMAVEAGGRPDSHVMIIGAGAAANLLIREIQQNEALHGKQIVCIIDDDTDKIGKRLHGVRVVGNRYEIPVAVKKYSVDEIILAAPSLPASDRASILNICNSLGCAVKTMPNLTDLVEGRKPSTTLRDVNIEDLLGRDMVDVDLSKIAGYVSGRVVLVTGGGGSIGSELCRQIARHNPKQLIIFDIYENNAYFVQHELKTHWPQLNLTVLIGSVRDEARIDSLFDTYRPDIVFHAAAHKHVPLMEDSPNEAVKNNVFGTLNVVRAADRYGVSRFVMISTDKAVNPTNVMGATKRICEMIIQSWNRRSATEYVAVRFGNVLGSNGSVIPLFQEQIRAGGPVCVTHPDIIRYFMTIPEAVSLVLFAGALAHGGEIFVLDMGKPVKILDLAENLIRLSGHVPNGDIKIEFTGLRPGEKLYEEMLMSEEGLAETENKLVHIGRPIPFDEALFLERLECLRGACMDNSVCVRKLISELVPTYRFSERDTEVKRIAEELREEEKEPVAG